MKQVTRQRPRYPRIECSVPECKRGTTIFEPGTDMICGRCWRKAPKELRQKYSKWRRAATAAEKLGDPRANVFGHAAHMAWDRIFTLLTAPVEDNDSVPPLMAEQLRKDGLLDG